MIPINYQRRVSSEVRIGNLCMGGNHPLRIQTMLNTNTNDTEACVRQGMEVYAAGAEMLRLTTQGLREAKNMRLIRQALREQGCELPLVADVHFNPAVANEALLHVEKVRINPGNYASTPEEIEAKFIPFLQACKAHHTAIRIGVNHGSLSKRMMQQYGDTPEGMVESCLEFLRLCQREQFSAVVVSVKASNVRVMVHTVRLMVARMEAEDMHFPLHLGVTEAGEGEDGRIKSAVGIGTLLAEGIGDTLRVSLSENPAAELPVARKIVELIAQKAQAPRLEGSAEGLYAPFHYQRRASRAVSKFGGEQVPQVLKAEDILPEGVLDCVLTHPNALGEARLYFAQLKEAGNTCPVVLSRRYETADLADLQLLASMELGPLFLDGLGDGLRIIAPQLPAAAVESLAYGILQATRCRMSKTEYISCPGCGRTLYDLQSTIARIKAATQHLKTLKIGIMGCIVNGPGEMADADYGYVGAGRGRVSLYRGQTCVERNLPEEEAVEHLIALIQSDGRWE